MPIIFFIMFLIIVGVIVYLIYDYMEYKDDVDKSFEVSTKYINDAVIKVSDNIDITEKNMSQRINQTDTDVKRIDVQTDNINNKLNNSLATVNQNFSKAYNNDMYLYNAMNLSHSNLIRNDIYLNNTMHTNYESLVRKGDELNTSISNINSSLNNSLNNFDSALKKYFTFSEGNQRISNNKIFEHVFSGVTPNLELISHVDTVSGITVKTPANTIDNKNLKVCNNLDGCIHMNVDNDGFNITPENLDNLTINSKQNKPLAMFDMQNDSIYFGGSDINAPMFIQNSNLYLNNVNFILKEAGQNNTNDLANLQIARLTGEDLNSIINEAEALQSDLDAIINSSKNLIVQYSLLNQTNNNVVTNNIIFKINVMRQLKAGDSILFKIPRSEIGNLLSDSYTFSSIGNSNYINLTQSAMTSQGDYIVFDIKLNSQVLGDTAILVKVSGDNILSSNRQMDNTVGVAIAQIYSS